MEVAEPAMLESLRRSSIITSTVASCAIEQIFAPEFESIAAADRPIGRDLNRDEKELSNYKSALEFVYSRDPKNIRIEPDFILELHRYVRADAGDAGEFKGADNQIVDQTKHGDVLRFQPVSARETPRYIEQLCVQYQRSILKEEAPKLLSIAALILDLTAIHPFSDGNGRVSRVLADAALISAGYNFPKYVSLEKINSKRDVDYYRALQLSSEGWHTRTHDLGPFLRFHTRMVVQAYRELDVRRRSSQDPLVVVFHDRVPLSVQKKVMAGFHITYPKATAEVTKEGVKDVLIKGHRSDLPEEQWEKLNHAEKLARLLLGKIKFAPLPDVPHTASKLDIIEGGMGDHDLGGRASPTIT